MFFYTVLLYTHTLYKYQVKTMTNTATIHTNNIVSLNAHRVQPGWHDLIADNLVFQKATDLESRAIRIQKPSAEQVPQWIKRLVMSGTCETIYVENLQLDSAERLTIEKLCSEYSVSLIGLSVNDNHVDNVVHGPW